MNDSKFTVSAGNKKTSIPGYLAGRILSIFGKKTVRPTSEDYKRIEFGTSTQRMGIRFTEKIRKVFRFKWIRKS